MADICCDAVGVRIQDPFCPKPLTKRAWVNRRFAGLVLRAAVRVEALDRVVARRWRLVFLRDREERLTYFRERLRLA